MHRRRTGQPTAATHGGIGNTFEGGTGYGTITGTAYADRYVFNLGDGQDVITDSGSYSTSATCLDKLMFGAGISPADVQALREGNDLVLSLANDTDQITVKSWFTSPSKWIEQVVFADGTVWSAYDVTYNRALAGTDADQTLVAVNGTDGVIHGGNGNDTITGGDGNDILHGDAGNACWTVVRATMCWRVATVTTCCVAAGRARRLPMSCAVERAMTR